MISKAFVTAGKAYFTIEVPAAFQQEHDTPAHWTFQIRHKEAKGQWAEIWFVSLLIGPDNWRNYQCFGMLNPETGTIRMTSKTTMTLNTWSVRILGRVLANVWADTTKRITDNGFDVHHMGKCGSCGRALTVPASIKSGIGPICAGKM